LKIPPRALSLEAEVVGGERTGDAGGGMVIEGEEEDEDEAVVGLKGPCRVQKVKRMQSRQHKKRCRSKSP
jgi:hypothetical protein